MAKNYQYNSIRSAKILIKERGVRNVCEEFDRFLERIEEPEDGCIVSLESDDEVFGNHGIYLDGKIWTVFKDKGVARTSIPIKKVWRISSACNW